MEPLHKQRNLDLTNDSNIYFSTSISFMRSFDKGDVKICKVPTYDNINDLLTKPLMYQNHDGHTRSLGIRYMSVGSSVSGALLVHALEQIIR